MAAVEAAGIGENPGAKSLLVKDGKESQEENGAASHLSEHCDASFAGAEPNRQQAPASKLKKTAFKFFGGKRSICTLPSFFGGKNKSQAKGASKKGLSKSKTHDGISDVAHEEAASGCLRSPSDGGPDFPPPQVLPSSQSAVLGAELRVGFAQPSNLLSSSTEGFEKKLTGEKSLFLPRSKKGLKGLFNSIRRHRKNKVAEPEKTELQEWALRDTVAKEQPRGNGLGGSLQRGTVTPERGESFSGDAVPPMAASHNEAGGMDCLASSPIRSVGEAARGPACPKGSQDGQPSLQDACADSAYGDLPEAFEPEFLQKSPPCEPSGEQLSLMFGEVTSLKSFDSFTGCGDIIAEPDIDSITESSTSVERNREAAKRTSCLVTYQGGGEEMALPEDLEEYLQQMWAGAIKGGADPEAHLPELITKGDLQGMKDAKQEIHLYPEGTRNDTDLLTPHSDQQESVPNSDEGYYDSTTPGPEDEAGDGLDEVKKDRLPRDSYSGDALYEFYEPEDALMSPSHGEGSWFDGKVSPSKIFDQFLDFALPDEKDLIWLMDQKSEAMEKQRLATLQKQLLFWEMQRDPALKHLQELRRDQHLSPGQMSECKMQATSLVGKSSSCLGCEQMNFCALDEGLSGGKKLAENPDWKDDFHKKLCPEKLCGSSTTTTKAHSSCLIQPSENSSELDSSGEHPVFDASASGNSVTCPLYRAHGHPGCSPRADFQEPCQEGSEEPEQAVNFSQALVEFTSNGTLFSSLSESLRSSDSGSAFTQNFPDLPTMVTFDIVDVEQEGEGECEEHLELNTEEDLTASFEAFRDTYDSKASFAECDERMFPEYSQVSSHWGAASLPRRLRLQELSPPLLEPLSVCRRSRSLDTESLEFELASLQLSKDSFRPFELWSGSKKDPGSLGLDIGQEGVPHSPGEKEEGVGGFSWPGRLNAPRDKEEFSLQETKAGEAGSNTLPSRGPWGLLERSDTPPPLACLGQNPTKEPAGRNLPADGSNHPVLPALRPLTRPSTLFLQAPVMSPEGCTSQRPGS
ncbi:APC membrane recruitment protein 1 [Crotalus adamanteus]|uniref:APC membrane recruitment protein 1 n=1 Tax=Crotalus adamanteus TaxID=8729 RepID=A0AAW1AUZ2_CROAD